MRAVRQKGKGYLCFFIPLFIFSLFLPPHAREEGAIYAYNRYNLERVLEQIVQLPEINPEINKGPFGALGSDYKNRRSGVF